MKYYSEKNKYCALMIESSKVNSINMRRACDYAVIFHHLKTYRSIGESEETIIAIFGM
jgi:hypothetical protein